LALLVGDIEPAVIMPASARWVRHAAVSGGLVGVSEHDGWTATDERFSADVAPPVAVRRRPLFPRNLPRHLLSSQQRGIVAAVAAGGAIGASARYAVGLAWPTPAGTFPWATFAVNLVGCFLIGVLLVPITEVWAAHPLLRPFAATGILGGFTTFSAYAVDIHGLFESAGSAGIGLLYLLATPVGALAAVWAGVEATRLAVRGLRKGVAR
jgi:CrcB protein